MRPLTAILRRGFAKMRALRLREINHRLHRLRISVYLARTMPVQEVRPVGVCAQSYDSHGSEVYPNLTRKSIADQGPEDPQCLQTTV
jgi:hypothetical protein